MPSGVRDRLEEDAVDRGMLDAEAHDRAELVLVDPALDRGGQRDADPGGGAVVERRLLDRLQAPAANREMGGIVEAVELEVDVNPERGERGREARVAREPDAVGVEHHQRDSARLRGGQHVEDLGMDRRLAARQLHRFGLALRGDERVQHRLDLRERERVAVRLMPGARLGEADRAVEVAAGVDLDDPEAGVLGVLGADAAVARAAPLGHGLAQQRSRARPVVALRFAPAIAVAVRERLDQAVLGAFTTQDHPPVSLDQLRVEADAAMRADRPSRCGQGDARCHAQSIPAV